MKVYIWLNTEEKPPLKLKEHQRKLGGSWYLIVRNSEEKAHREILEEVGSITQWESACQAYPGPGFNSQHSKTKSKGSTRKLGSGSLLSYVALIQLIKDTDKTQLFDTFYYVFCYFST